MIPLFLEKHYLFPKITFCFESVSRLRKKQSVLDDEVSEMLSEVVEDIKRLPEKQKEKKVRKRKKKQNPALIEKLFLNMENFFYGQVLFFFLL